MKRRLWLGTIALLLTAGPHVFTAEPGREDSEGTQRHDWAVRWVLLKYSNGDLGKDPDAAWQEMERLVHRAAKAGYNGIVYADRDEYWYKGNDVAFWQERLGDLRQLTRTLGMELLVACVPAKTGGNAEMAESFPIKDAPLVVKDGVLVPVNTAFIRNGSFEQFEGHTPAYFSLPEAGKHALMDQNTQAHEGRTSIRVQKFEEVAGRNAMPVQTVAVKPFHQYRISFWLKVSEDFKSTIRVMAYVPGDGGKDRDICRQEPSISSRTPRNEWFKIQATFNSWNNSQVKLLVGPINWGQTERGRGTQGDYWLDDIRIEDIPFLNVNRRAELPNQLVGEDGQVYVEGKDYARIVDPAVDLGWQPHYGIDRRIR